MRQLICLYFPALMLFPWSACYHVRNSGVALTPAIAAQQSVYPAGSDCPKVHFTELKRPKAEKILSEKGVETVNNPDAGYVNSSECGLTVRNLNPHEPVFSFSSRLSFDTRFKSPGFERSTMLCATSFGNSKPSEENVFSRLDSNVSVDVNAMPENDFTFKANKTGPASWLRKCRLERPIISRFNPSDEPSFILYFGIKKSSKSGGSSALPKTGVVWKIDNMKNK